MTQPNELVTAYRKLIDKHYSAVQTDTALEHADNYKLYKLEKKAKMFWDDFYSLEADFLAKLENTHANG